MRILFSVIYECDLATDSTKLTLLMMTSGLDSFQVKLKRSQRWEGKQQKREGKRRQKGGESASGKR